MSDTTIEEPVRWEPIAGVDLKTYARVIAVLLTRGATGAEATELVAGLGIPASTWAAAREGWTRRIANEEDARDAYAEFYRRARGRQAIYE